jgi:hypothetical protein
VGDDRKFGVGKQNFYWWLSSVQWYDRGDWYTAMNIKINLTTNQQ